MFILTKTMMSDSGYHAPLVLNYGFFPTRFIDVRKISLYHRLFLLSFVFSLNTIEGEFLYEDVKNNFNLSGDCVKESFKEHLIIKQQDPSEFNYVIDFHSFVLHFQDLFYKLRLIFVDDWVEANSLFCNWKTYNSYEGYYSSFDFPHNFITNSINVLGFIAFVVFEKKDINFLKNSYKMYDDIIKLMPKHLLTERYSDGLTEFVQFWNDNLRSVYNIDLSDVVDNLSFYDDYLRRFVKFLIDLILTSFTYKHSAEGWYKLYESFLDRHGVYSDFVGFTLDRGLAYNRALVFTSGRIERYDSVLPVIHIGFY